MNGRTNGGGRAGALAARRVMGGSIPLREHTKNGNGKSLSTLAASSFGAVPEVSTPHAPADRYPTAIDPDPEPGVEINLGVAGRSAMGEFERRHAGREARIRERWGRLAGLVLALSDDPQSTRAW